MFYDFSLIVTLFPPATTHLQPSVSHLNLPLGSAESTGSFPLGLVW